MNTIFLFLMLLLLTWIFPFLLWIWIPLGVVALAGLIVAVINNIS